MSLSIRHRETLVYHDGPVLFVGIDGVDTLYLCAIVEKTAQMDIYLCAPVSQRRLAELRRGLVPVRSVFEYPEQDRIVILEVTDQEISESQAKLVQSSDIASDWLPSPDFYYRDEPAPREIVLRQARERQKAIVHVELDAPETMGRGVIPVSRLGHVLTHIALFVNHAYNESIRYAEEKSRDLLKGPENSALNVIGFAPGSFVVHLESVSNSDMFGHVNISRALRLFVELNSTLGDKEKAIEALRKHPGRVASSYKNLLKYIVETQTPITVQWATPEHKAPEATGISMSNAEAVYEELVEMHELDTERKTVKGALLMADIPHGTWRIRSDQDGKEYHGDIDPESDATLEGVTLETVRYKIVYVERTEGDVLGTEKLKLSLVSIRPVKN